MGHLLKRLRNTHLQFRVALPVVMAMILIVFTQWGCYEFAAGVITEQAQASAESAAASISSHMNGRIHGIVNQIRYTKLDLSIQGDLTDYLLRGELPDEATAMTQLMDSLSVHKVTEPLICGILLYTPEYMFSGDGMPLINSFQFEHSEVAKLLEKQEGDLAFSEPVQDEMFVSRRNVVHILYRFHIEGYVPECVLIVNLDQQKISNFLLEALPENGSQVVMLTADGTPIVASKGSEDVLADKDLCQQIAQSEEMLEVTSGGVHYIAGSIQLEDVDWTILYLHSQEDALNTLSNLRFLFSGITVGIICFLLWCIRRILKTVTVPLREMQEHFCTSENTYQLTDFQYPYRDEIGELVHAYNSMAGHLQQLLEERQVHIQQLEQEKMRADIEQQLKRKAELQALQAQINPHFLYNTLDSIRWKAEMAGAKDVSEMTASLATLFRVSLSKGREIIPIRNELLHVESYLKIQKTRYRDRMNYTMDVEPELLELYTVKLLLQPLVENAIEHGIKESDHSGKVSIRGYAQGNRVIFQVTDDGLGIPEEHLRVLQRELWENSVLERDGYGIFNVNERIRLYFGAEYGLTLESQWQSGTVATLTLPKITLPEVEQYVPYHDC